MTVWGFIGGVSVILIGLMVLCWLAAVEIIIMRDDDDEYEK